MIVQNEKLVWSEQDEDEKSENSIFNLEVNLVMEYICNVVT